MIPSFLRRLSPATTVRAEHRRERLAQAVLADLSSMPDGVPASDGTGRISVETLATIGAAARRDHAEGRGNDKAIYLAGTAAILSATGIRLHPEQIVGAIVLSEGRIAELATGEGKTLVAILSAWVAHLSGSVHVVTVNDYLVDRDADLAERVLGPMGVSVGRIHPSSTHEDRVAAYSRDIVYVTGAELGFDLLRDSIASHPSLIVAPVRRAAIVDEVDSLLIDEARIPIVISEKTTDTAPMVSAIGSIVDAIPKSGFDTDERHDITTPKERTWADLEDALHSAGILSHGVGLQDPGAASVAHRVEQAVRARFQLGRDRDYIVREGAVVLVDRSTGQISEGRSFSDGLHQAVEAREGLSQSPESLTVASITYQSLFRGYDTLCGLSGTAMSDKEEFSKVYGLDVVAIPTHAPVARIDDRDEIYRNRAEKLDAVVHEIEEAHARLQPILVGSRSIERCREVAAALVRAGFERRPANDAGELDATIQAAMSRRPRRVFRILDALDPEFEAHVVAQAGIPGAITIATTIAGRGTDVKLGGDADFHASLAPEGTPRETIVSLTAQLARMAKECGGLYAIGTERLDNRRMDDQFRGRSGRQGDPGRSRFFLSLDDDLLRGHDGISKIAERAGLGENQALSAGIVDKAVSAAQRSREAMHFEMRNVLLRMDDVLEEQRGHVAGLRADALQPEDPFGWLREMANDVCAEIVTRNAGEKDLPEQWDVDGLARGFSAATRINVPVREMIDRFDLTTPTQVTDRLTSIYVDVVSTARSTDEAGFDAALSGIILHHLDHAWRLHVDGVEHLRKGIFLREGNRDGGPLAVYRSESARSFETMIAEWRRNVVSTARSLVSTASRAA